jgi:hypothetical protein
MGNKKYLKKFLFLSAFLIVARNTYTEEKSSEERIVLKEISTNVEEKIDLDAPYEEQSLVTPGRITLKNNGGYIYSIVDPIPADPKLSIKSNKKQDIKSNQIK